MSFRLVRMYKCSPKKLKTLFYLICSGALLIANVFPLRVMAADPVTITSPQENGSVININLQIKGKAPPSTIITVVIKDTDTNRAQIAHQSSGQVIGSVTSSGVGDWTYVPGLTLVLGQYSVQATYTNDENTAISSNTVQFVVVNSQGSSEQISNSVLRLILTIATASFIVVCVVVFLLIKLRRRLSRKRKEKVALPLTQNPVEPVAPNNTVAPSTPLSTPQRTPPTTPITPPYIPPITPTRTPPTPVIQKPGKLPSNSWQSTNQKPIVFTPSISSTPEPTIKLPTDTIPTPPSPLAGVYSDREPFQSHTASVNTNSISDSIPKRIIHFPKRIIQKIRSKLRRNE